MQRTALSSLQMGKNPSFQKGAAIPRIHMEKFKAWLRENDLPKVTQTSLIQFSRLEAGLNQLLDNLIIEV